MIRSKRAYEPASSTDGYRVLVDRLWPRGLRKTEAHLDGWLKELAPSDDLRRWFHHEPDRFGEFRDRYERELRGHRIELDALARHGARRTVTLVYSSRDPVHNNAVVLAGVLRRRARDLR